MVYGDPGRQSVIDNGFWVLPSLISCQAQREHTIEPILEHSAESLFGPNRCTLFAVRLSADVYTPGQRLVIDFPQNSAASDVVEHGLVLHHCRPLIGIGSVFALYCLVHSSCGRQMFSLL